MKTKKMVIVILSAAFAAGCGRLNYEPMEIKIESYNQAEYSGIAVLQGDLYPELTLTLKQADYKLTKYGSEQDGLKLDKLLVEVGEIVEPGQVMATFISEELEDKKKTAEKIIHNNEVRIEHLNKMMEIDKKADFKEEIKMLTEDNELQNMYLNEYDLQLATLSIVAQAHGTVVYIDDKLKAGYYEPNEKMIGVGGGNGYYSATMKEDYDFNIGDEFTASLKDIDYKLRLIEIKKTKTTELIFEPISDMTNLTSNDKPEMNIAGDVLKDVVYINKKALRTGERGDFVFKISEDKSIDAVSVVTGREVGDYIVIEEGLSAGEEILLK